MTTMQQHLTMAAQSQAAQHDDPHPTPVCPASPEGAIPLQSATLSHKKIPLSEIEALAAAQQRWNRGQATQADIALVNSATHGEAKAAHRLNQQRKRLAEMKGDPSRFIAEYGPDAVDAKDLALRPGNVWQMKPEPKLESYEGIPAEVINEATIMGDDTPYVVIQKLEAQMKGRWAMVRFGQSVAMKMVSVPEEMAEKTPTTIRGEESGSRRLEAAKWATSLRDLRLRANPDDFGYIMCWLIEPRKQRSVVVGGEVAQRAVDRMKSARPDDAFFVQAVAVEMYLEHGPEWLEGRPPEEMVNVRGVERNVDEYCVATPVKIKAELHFDEGVKVVHDTLHAPVPCTIPSLDEALAMRELVEKVAAALHGKNEAARELSFLNVTREYGGHIAAWTDDAVAAEREEIGRRSKGE